MSLFCSPFKFSVFMREKKTNQVFMRYGEQDHLKPLQTYISQIQSPFEYGSESIAFFDVINLKCYEMFYLEQGNIKQIPSINLPTKSFKEVLSMEDDQMDDFVLEKYLGNSISIKYNIKKKVLIVSENLSIFETQSGDICDDIIFSSWTSSGQVGEALIKKTREPLRFNFIDDSTVIIYRQSFYKEKLQFYVWSWATKTEFSIPIIVNQVMDICLLNCFFWRYDTFSKEEYLQVKQDPDILNKQVVDNLQVAFIANQNGSKHPQIIFVNFDASLRQVFSFRIIDLVLDSSGSMLIQALWVYPQQREICVQHYTSDMKLLISIYNIDRAKKFKLFHQSREDVVSSNIVNCNCQNRYILFHQCRVFYRFLTKDEQ